MPATSPNVLFILTDDQGYGDLSCHGNPILKTPALDKLHGESVRMTDFHVGPTCAPTRSSLMTGHYANSTGVWHTIGGRSLLRENEWTLAAALGQAGYRTGIFGKWHLGDEYPFRPGDRGFETSVVHGGGGISQTPDYWGNDYFDDTYFVNGQAKPFEGYCTDVWFRLGREFIEQDDDRPFFCMITPNAPHGPCNVEPHYAEPFFDLCPDERARFNGMIVNIDENVAAIRQFLDDKGLAENTIVMFMTDNGTASGCSLDDNQFVAEGYNAGMRGKKCSQYEGGHRVPWFIHWPGGGLLGGRDVDALTSCVDVMPTVLDWCGAKVPADRSFHGTSLAPVIADKSQPALDERIVVTDSQRITDPIKWRQSSAMLGKWRLVDRDELYDVSSDPEQRRDIASEHPQMVERLREGYEQWWELVSTQFDEMIPFAIRRDAPTLLTGHDWRNENASCPWNHGLIRRGHESNGHWEIDVRDAGRYHVELRRWPTEANAPIRGLPEPTQWRKDAVPERFAAWYSGEKALAIDQAQLIVGGQTYEADVGTDDVAVTFEAELPAGEQKLMTRFIESSTGIERGAYYVAITALTAE